AAPPARRRRARPAPRPAAGPRRRADRRAPHWRRPSRAAALPPGRPARTPPRRARGPPAAPAAALGERPRTLGSKPPPPPYPHGSPVPLGQVARPAREDGRGHAQLVGQRLLQEPLRARLGPRELAALEVELREPERRVESDCGHARGLPNQLVAGARLLDLARLPSGLSAGQEHPRACRGVERAGE